MFHKADSSIGVGGKKAMDAPLRKSDRRKLRDVAARFFEYNDNTTKVSSELLDAIFMQDSLVVRRLQHAQLNKVQLYYRGPAVGNESDNQGLWPYSTTTECVWMTVDLGPGEPTMECPSVAVLSLIVNFPAVDIPSDASKYLCRGAHLMRAGIISLPNTHGLGIVAIRVRGNPQPFAVGLFRPALKNEVKGIGVQVWMCYGDDIYRSTTAMAGKGSGPINPVGGANFNNGHYGNVGFLDGILVRPIRSSTDEEDGDDDDEVDETDANGTEQNEPCPRSDGEEAEIGQSTSVKAEEDPVSPDDVLHQATCHALVNVSDKELPMLLSTFYANHVLKQVPNDTVLQLKQTSYKKFGTYMLHQQKRGLLVLAPDKNDNNPAGCLKAVTRSHEDLRGIRKTKKDDPSGAAGKKIKQIVTLYVIPHYFVNLMRLDVDDVKAANAKSQERRGTGYLTNPEVRAILDKYCLENELISDDGGMVTLDGPLTDALYKRTNNCDSPPQTSMSRKDLSVAWAKKMEPAYALVQMPGSQIIKMARGMPPKVQIEVSRIGGNKFVTRLRGVEEYDIDAAALCKEVVRRFACAGTIVDDDPQLGALKKGHAEVVFQGNLVEELQALLLGDERLSSHGGAKGSAYSLPKESIAVTLKKGVPSKKRK
ncbi:Translation initiation factor SUI1 [Fragilaria crotonensis]|nr:Translation initiation factor SUI1 [Fragilaria crotonensis]